MALVQADDEKGIEMKDIAVEEGRGESSGGDTPSPAAEKLEDDYAKPADMPDAHKGYGPGKCGLQEVCFGGDPNAPRGGGLGSYLTRPIVFNPWVSVLGASVLWGFAIYCIEYPEDSKQRLGEWQTWVTECFTWLYIGSQDIWIIFMGFVYYYYGGVKLGKDDSKPEFDNLTYFAMIFAAGVAVGLFVYGTAEPLYHYDFWLKHRFNGVEGVPENDKANYAMLMTIFHWGFHGWVVYTLVGLQMGLMAYRRGLPLLMRTCFYPLLGKATWGWIGDLIDAFSIVTIVAGVCTSLGLGVIQIVKGMQGMGDIDALQNCDDDCMVNAYQVCIWCITAVATISVVSGLHMGIKTLSQVAFSLGLFLWFAVFIMGDTWFYLNNITQSIGYYLQYFLTQLGWHTDAFAQLHYGHGASPDGGEAYGPNELHGASQNFMNGWTIFYWGWWIAWAPFVGMFVARISRGRTVSEVMHYTLTAPLIFVFLWFGVFGGAAIQMENNANLLMKAGLEIHGEASHFQTGQWGNEQTSYHGMYVDKPVLYDGSNDGKFGTAVNGGGRGACFVNQASFGDDACENFEAQHAGEGIACPKWIKEWQGNKDLTPQCLFTDWDQEASWYNVLNQFYGFGPFLNGVSILALILYFVTSSDSGSLVVDTLAANGRDEQNPFQRIFWALTEGGVASGLVSGASSTSPKDVLKSLQAASICSGLPFTILLCIMMPAIWIGLRDDKKRDSVAKGFATPVYGGIFDYFAWGFTATFSVCTGSSLPPLPSHGHVVGFFVASLCPFIYVFRIQDMYGDSHRPLTMFGSSTLWNIIVTLVSTTAFYSWIVLLAYNDDGHWAMGWIMFFVFVSILAGIRFHCRSLAEFDGNLAEDFFASLFAYPQVLVQIHEELTGGNPMVHI